MNRAQRVRRGALAALAIVTASCSRGPLTIDTSAAGLTVHEWGTYTSVQGSNGATLEGMQHEEEALPDFVARRSPTVGGEKGIESVPEPVTQKLETPVIYFYGGDRVDRVHVTVDFPSGIVSQWFPAAATFAPAVGSLAALSGGHMEWTAELRPHADSSTMRAVPEDSVWAPARRTAAVPIAIGADVERFIFYRGLGRFDVPFRVLSSVAANKEQSYLIEAHNDSDEDIADAFLLDVHDDGGVTVPLGRVTAHAARAGIAVPPVDPGHGLDRYVSDTMDVVAAALVRSGLYADEARAMVETWSRSYFRTPGTRILYVAPRAWTDRLLPLTIGPTPVATVRTLIGRVELVTVAEENVLLTRSRTEAAGSLASSLGRFAEPKLRRVRQLAVDPLAASTLDTAIAEAAGQP
jgi:hypothetical protein